MTFGKFQVGKEGVKPWLPGDNLVSDARNSQVDQNPWGFGCPSGAPRPVREITLWARDWARCREQFDRPVLLVPKDDFVGPIYVYECQQAPSYCAGSPNWLYDARVYRRGQTIFINRPGRYSFFLDQVAEPVRCLVYDWASIWNDDPHVKYVTGYDPTLPGWRGVGATATDPAALLVSDIAAAAAAAALAPLVTPVAPAGFTIAWGTVTVASGLVAAAGAGRKRVLITNAGPNTMYLSTAGPAAIVTDIPIEMDGAYEILPSAGVMPAGAFYAITRVGTADWRIEIWY